MKPRDMKTLTVKSPAFQSEAVIPTRYTCDGANVNPALEVSDLPKETKSLALIVDDPDAPGGTWTHWLVWDIVLTSGRIEEKITPGIQGTNDFGELQYGGPCPPGGTHRYYFKVYALNSQLNLPEGSNRQELLNALEGHVLAYGELMGRYSR